MKRFFVAITKKELNANLNQNTASMFFAEPSLLHHYYAKPLSEWPAIILDQDGNKYDLVPDKDLNKLPKLQKLRKTRGKHV